MSLNELTIQNTKPWLNVRANNLAIDTNLSVTGAVPGYALTYHGPDNISFSPVNNLKVISYDEYYVVPIINASTSPLDFSASPVANTNFTINGSNNLVCSNSGDYLISFNFAQASGVNNSRPILFLSRNGTTLTNTIMSIPLCTSASSNIPAFASLRQTLIVTLTAMDEITLNMSIQPAGTITMENVASATNIILIKLS